MSENIKRIYRSTEAGLIQDADYFLDIMDRDAADLINFGIGLQSKDGLIALRLVLDDTSTDEEMQGYVVVATAEKDEWEVKVRDEIRLIAGRVAIKYGDKSPKHNQFTTKLLSKVTGDNLLRHGKRVLKLATKMLADLASTGLTQPMLQDFADLLHAFDESIDAQRGAIGDRDYEVDVRVNAGNNVYEAMKPISIAGKLCYEKTSPAKANQYNLTHTHPSPTIQIIEGNVPATQGLSTTVMDAVADTSLEIFNTGTGPLHFFFAENITDLSGPSEVVIAAGMSLTIIAANLGFLDNVRERLNVFNPGPDAGSYRIEWE